MKNFLKLISLFLCFSLFFIPIKANAHRHTAYSHDSNVDLNKQNWMARLSDSITINELSIPGTGNSMSYGNHTDFSLTQSMDLETQLESGIRFLDLTVDHVGEFNFRVVTGMVDLGVSVIDVLEEVRDFLRNNREETVLVKISMRNSENGNFGNYLKRAIESADLSQYIFDGSKTQNPTLGEVRGKVILLSDYSGNRWKSIPYNQNTKIQDSNHLNTNWDLYSKWEKVKDHLNKTNKSHSKNIRYVNYLTGGGGSFPYFVASGHVSSATDAARLSTGLTEPGFSGYYKDFPRVNRFGVFATIAFEGINTLTYNYILDKELKFVGIVVADFPGAGLIDEIIGLNFPGGGTSSQGSGVNISSGGGSTSGSSSSGSSGGSNNTDGWGFTYRKG